MTTVNKQTARDFAGTEWRFEISDAEPMDSAFPYGQFIPDLVLVLHYSKGHHCEYSDDETWTEIQVLGQMADRPTSLDTGRREFRSEALNPTYSLAAMPQWLREFVKSNTTVRLSS